RGDRRISLARETLTILRSYPFPGNVRELQNLLKAALIECEGETIFPHHLPLRSMGAFVTSGDGNAPNTAPAPKNESGRSHEELFLELRRSLPENWLELGHRDARQYYEQAFDRVYLRYLIERNRYNVKRAAEAAGIDPKTLRRRWEECGLPPLRAGDEK